MDFFYLVVSNKIIQSCFFAAVIAQSIKAYLAWRYNHKFHWRYLFITAGMPSTHTATVMALSTGVYLTSGFSTLFVATSVLSFIVIRDVIGDKVFAQQQEDMVNDIFEKISKGEFEAIKWNTLIGHTLKEVLVGLLLGLLVALFIFNKLG